VPAFPGLKPLGYTGVAEWPTGSRLVRRLAKRARYIVPLLMDEGAGGHRGWRETRVVYCGIQTSVEGMAVPLYEYKCVKCGRRTEKIEPVSGPHLKKCPHCGGKVEQAITAPAIQFKGSGWYVTDYAGKSPAKDSAAEKGDGEKSEKKDAGAKDGGAKEGAGKETKESKDSGDKKAAKKK
jgi:putative FmdB family regulatory protein